MLLWLHVDANRCKGSELGAPTGSDGGAGISGGILLGTDSWACVGRPGSLERRLHTDGILDVVSFAPQSDTGIPDRTRAWTTPDSGYAVPTAVAWYVWSGIDDIPVMTCRVHYPRIIWYRSRE